MHRTGVIHGRFQVLHNDHLRYLLAGKARCHHLVVGVTNPDPSLTRDDEADPGRSQPQANPLSFYERHRIIQACLLEAGVGPTDFSIVPLPINLPQLISHYVPQEAVCFLTIYDRWGEKKLRLFQSLGFQTEVLWRRPASQKGITATQVRRLIASGGQWEPLVPPASARLMRELGLVERIRNAEGFPGT